jgi:hypothetical protein
LRNTLPRRGGSVSASRFDPDQKKPKYFFDQGQLFSARLITAY